MHLSDRIRQLEKDNPIGSESALVRKRWWYATAVHGLLFGYSSMILAIPIGLYWAFGKRVLGNEDVSFHILAKPNPFSRVGNRIERLEGAEIYRKAEHGADDGAD